MNLSGSVYGSQPPEECLVCESRLYKSAGLAHNVRMNASPPPQRIDSKLLDILVCPLTKGPLSYDADRQELVSRQAKLAYPIRDGIPILLIDEARKLDD